MKYDIYIWEGNNLFNVDNLNYLINQITINFNNRDLKNQYSYDYAVDVGGGIEYYIKITSELNEKDLRKNIEEALLLKEIIE